MPPWWRGKRPFLPTRRAIILCHFKIDTDCAAEIFVSHKEKVELKNNQIDNNVICNGKFRGNPS